MQFEGHATLLDVFNSSVERFGDRKCLGWRPIDAQGAAGPYEFLTYKEVHAKAQDLASALSQSGVSKDGKLGILSANCVEWMLAIRAVDVVSATIVPIYDSLGKDAVEYIIKHSELTVALVESSKLGAIAAVASAVAGQMHTLVYVGKEDAASLDAIRSAGITVHSFAEFLELGKKKAVKVVPPTPDHVACIMYTR